MNTQFGFFFFKLCLLQKVSLGIKAQDKLGAASGSIFNSTFLFNLLCHWYKTKFYRFLFHLLNLK